MDLPKWDAPETGAEIFQLQVQNKYSSFNRFVPPVIDNKFIYVGTFVGYLCGINIETQQKSWEKLKLECRQLNSILFADGIIYCESSGTITALDAQSGKELWRFMAPEPDWWFLNPRLWKSQLVNIFSKLTAGFSFIQFSPPVIADGIVYILCRNGYLYALH